VAKEHPNTKADRPTSNLIATREIQRGGKRALKKEKGGEARLNGRPRKTAATSVHLENGRSCRPRAKGKESKSAQEHGLG